MCCTSGRGVVEVQGRTFPLRDNEALCIPRLCPHRYWADEEDPWSLLWVHFQGEDCGYYPLDRPQVCRFSSAGTVRRMEFLFNQLFRTLEQDYTLGNFIYLSQLLALILGETYARRQEDGTTARQNRQVTRAVRICTATWTGNSRWRNSPPRWAPPRAPSARCSGSATGHAPMDFFTRLKMKQACRMLRSGGEYVYEVARQLGYRDPYYFSRAFKKVMGVSPRSYQNGLGRSDPPGDEET